MKFQFHPDQKLTVYWPSPNKNTVKLPCIRNFWMTQYLQYRPLELDQLVEFLGELECIMILILGYSPKWHNFSDFCHNFLNFDLGLLD